MSTTVAALEPRVLWSNFAKLNAVPRPSKKEERVIAFMKAFGENLGLETFVDEAGNVIIRKPASPGMEDRTPIVMQSHLDMVHQKNATTDFNFEEQGIEMYVDGDWVKAKGTTLGADNGLGVATIMAILESDTIAHPPLEALFTIDEETGMTGAMALKGGLLNGRILLNLDTEDDDELTIGCAGGVDVTATGTYTEELLPSGYTIFRISLKGLTGGHSGMDIHLGRGNANKLMNRCLYRLDQKLNLRIHSIDGGGLRNAIPRESFAMVAIAENEVELFEQLMEQIRTIFHQEYRTTDADCQLLVEPTTDFSKVFDQAFQKKLLQVIYACPNGIYRMSPDIDQLVQTSNNLARVEVKNGQYQILCLTRSSVDSEKVDEAAAISSTFALLGAQVTTSGDYPGWEPKPGAQIVQLMSTLYQERFNASAQVKACHAGLECGILGTHYPDMEMISFGPNIRGAHSPDEKAQISSVQKFWGYLLETLKQIP
ncbi:MAG: aminoacyl-histidine dipeptidase [Bacteroidota bacterium]